MDREQLKLNSTLNAKTEFDTFLYASLGDDIRGSAVSVLSAFARLGYDPWLKAAEFARLPTKAAEVGLALAIKNVPGMSPSRADAGDVAARLIALLPGARRKPAKSAREAFEAGHWPDFRSPKATIYIAIAMALGLLVQVMLSAYPSTTTNDTPTNTTATTPSSPGDTKGSTHAP